MYGILENIDDEQRIECVVVGCSCGGDSGIDGKGGDFETDGVTHKMEEKEENMKTR